MFELLRCHPRLDLSTFRDFVTEIHVFDVLGGPALAAYNRAVLDLGIGHERVAVAMDLYAAKLPLQPNVLNGDSLFVWLALAFIHDLVSPFSECEM